MNFVKSKNVKKTLFIIVVLSVSLVMAFGLSACGKSSAPENSNDKEKQQTSAYMSSLHIFTNEFKNLLNDFQGDIKDKKVDSMKDKLSRTDKAIDEFGHIEVPEQCKEVHQMYTDAFNKLQQALKDYVNLYSEIDDNNYESSQFKTKVEPIKTAYNEGVELLKQADKKSSEL